VCKHENLDDSKYCEECGHVLSSDTGGEVAKEEVTEKEPILIPKTCSLSFKDQTLNITVFPKVIGREDFVQHISQSEYKFVSSKHLTIFREDNEFFIQDGAEEDGNWKDSTNGTKLNGVEIKSDGKKSLENNNVILVADTIELTFIVKSGE